MPSKTKSSSVKKAKRSTLLCRKKAIKKEIKKYVSGRLYSNGKQVRNRKQAVAIALRAADFKCTRASIRKKYSRRNLKSMTIEQLRKQFSKLGLPSKLSKDKLITFITRQLYKLE